MKPSESGKDPLTLGVKMIGKEEQKGIRVAFETKLGNAAGNICGLFLYDRETGELIKRHVIDKDKMIGNVAYDMISDVGTKNISYLFFENDRMWTDEKAGAYVIEGRYGEKKAADDYKAVLVDHAYDWEDAYRPHLKFSESIIYCLHVRGFTNHGSAGVIGNGTFRGILEKLNYLKELGITTIELQPCYEFDEAGEKLNYWGYKEAYYYAPKTYMLSQRIR